MTQKPADELVKVVEATARKLKSLDEILVRSKPDPDRWSIQEILGHLLDSAVNNHHRFVRAQAVAEFDFPGYEQESWVGRSGLPGQFMAGSGAIVATLQPSSGPGDPKNTRGAAGDDLQDKPL